MLPFAVSDSQPKVAMLSASADVGSAATTAVKTNAGNRPTSRAAIRCCISASPSRGEATGTAVRAGSTVLYAFSDADGNQNLSVNFTMRSTRSTPFLHEQKAARRQRLGLG